MISTTLLDNSIFIFNAFSHFIFISIFIINNKILQTIFNSKIFLSNLIFILGHFLIIFTMIFRTFTSNILSDIIKNIIRVAGSMGHLFLFISVILNILIFKSINVDIFNLLFLLGQLGMIYFIPGRIFI